MPDEGFFFKRDKDDPYYKVLIPDVIPNLIMGKNDGEIFWDMYINERLEKEYPHIYRAIQEENYYISDDESCYYFFEIPYESEDNIIGFATFKIYNEEVLILNQIYVLPEYRGNSLFYKVLNYFMDLFDEAKIFIKNPNKTILDKLEEAEVLISLDDRLYISSIFFVYDLISFDETLEYTNKTYIEKKGRLKHQIISNLYDKKLNAIVNLASQNNKPFTGKENPNNKRCSISIVRDEDQNEHNFIKIRNQDPWIKKGNYFKKIKKIVYKKIREKGFTIA